tara:strand:- start:1991 stop:2851 length:861 start_codon:yes stop_codon:yes gene_type:complete
MGHYMEEDLWSHLCSSTFIFDLEYIGPTSDLKTCHIWEIGAIHYLSGASITITIYPDISPIPPPFSAEFIQVTPDLLKDRHAVSFTEAWAKLLHWVSTIVPMNQNTLWVAHNAFKADKPMLEVDTKRHGIVIPYNWFFFDSLIYCRQSIPKMPSYTLSDLYYSLFGSPLKNAHSALPDAIALRNVLLHINATTLIGTIYPAYATSLQSIKWLGPSSEKQFFGKHIQSLEQLISLLMTSYSTNCMLGSIVPIRTFVEQFLRTQVGLNSGNAVSISNTITNYWLPGTK